MRTVPKAWKNANFDFSRTAKCSCAFGSYEADWGGCKQLVVCIDYFSKWLEAKPLKDKLAECASLFLYGIICRYGCMKIQINDQGR